MERLWRTIVIDQRSKKVTDATLTGSQKYENVCLSPSGFTSMVPQIWVRQRSDQILAGCSMEGSSDSCSEQEDDTRASTDQSYGDSRVFCRTLTHFCSSRLDKSIARDMGPSYDGNLSILT
ncbi:hypothetical protein RRG08_041386 [Elysia crispata]|uniref:Uncharacterized protein n=1 Tax=Elysia crispata TaxID=231223 RepID=A0AAE0XRN7_9GAST|nr:hypothetical protein RRG08_041386 [Elysia crispata]